MAEPIRVIGGLWPEEGDPGRAALMEALRRLDALLERAVEGATVAYGPEASADPYRGLYVGHAEVGNLLARAPGSPTLWTGIEGWSDAPHSGSRLGRLARAFGLSEFDREVLLVALAPELDLRYERLYAYLQDDVTRKRPTVDLALNLLCPSWEAKLARREHFAPDAPLVRHGLLHLFADPSQPHPPLLSHFLKPDDSVIRFLLGAQSPDARLQPFCRPVTPDGCTRQAPLEPDAQRALTSLVSRAEKERQPLTLYFGGKDSSTKLLMAEALARKAGRELMTADIASVPDLEGEALIGLLFREATLRNWLLYVDGVGTLEASERAAVGRAFREALAGYEGVAILADTGPWAPASGDGRTSAVIPVDFPAPDFARRRDRWRARLEAAGLDPQDRDLDTLAGRFRLLPDGIDAAVTTAGGLALWRAAGQSASDTEPTMEELFAAARAHSAHGLDALALKLSPRYGWDDIVLPAERMRQLREICNHVKYRGIVYDEWGFDRKLALGKGLNVLFTGPSGTGKTMAAEIIARELGLDLYKIDLSTVVSKYIGETEKNLARIFAGAEASNAILLFDEADALFGRRSEVRDSHDRYANVEISYLLQRMEEYDGVVILTTNLRKNMDDAFVRRLHFAVEFPFPDETDRRRIWEQVWPAATPLDHGVDLGLLARRYELAGGNIRNVALSAAFLAAEDGGTVTTAHLLQATSREYQKMGKVVGEGEFGDRAR